MGSGWKNCIALHTTPNVSTGRTNALATMRQMTSWKSGYAQRDALAMFKKYENDAKNVNIQDARSPDRWMEEFACDVSFCFPLSLLTHTRTHNHIVIVPCSSVGFQALYLLFVVLVKS